MNKRKTAAESLASTRQELFNGEFEGCVFIRK
jgi:hypothetical protein